MVEQQMTKLLDTLKTSLWDLASIPKYPQADTDSPDKLVFSVFQQTLGARCCGFDSGYLDLF